jgi:nucleotide sugar dehydrogenase
LNETTMTDELANQMLDKVRRKSSTICVVGLGYVGLPTAVGFAKKGFHVIGTDLSRRKIDLLNQGQSPLKDLNLDDDLKVVWKAGLLSGSTDVVASCKAADIVLLIVPTPVKDNKDPDLSFVDAASRSAAKGLRRGQLIVLESTTYPGTTEEFVIPPCEATGLKAGIDFGIGYCPERYNPGDPVNTLETVNRVVSGITPAWARVCAELYGQLNENKIHVAPDLKTAEAAKVIENIQRDLNIALVNELALIFERLGIDTKAVLDAASTKWNFVRFQPGPGVGGHCLPVDPYYLTNLAARVGYHSRVILAGRAVNDGMPAHVVEIVVKALNKLGKAVNGSRIACLGLSYKANTGDLRESPAEHVARDLLRWGANLRPCDPWIEAAEIEEALGVKAASLEDACEDCDLILVLSDHDVFKQKLPNLVSSLAGLGAVVDTRGILDPKRCTERGIPYYGIGRYFE